MIILDHFVEKMASHKDVEENLVFQVNQIYNLQELEAHLVGLDKYQIMKVVEAVEDCLVEHPLMKGDQVA